MGDQLSNTLLCLSIRILSHSRSSRYSRCSAFYLSWFSCEDNVDLLSMIARLTVDVCPVDSPYLLSLRSCSLLLHCLCWLSEPLKLYSVCRTGMVTSIEF